MGMEEIGKVRNLLFGMVILIITDIMEEMSIVMINQSFILFQIVLEILFWLYQLCIKPSLLRSKLSH